MLATNLTGVKKHRQTLITSLPVLIANANLPDGNLNKELNLAILFQYDMAKTGSSLFDVLNQQTMFEQSVYNFKAAVINRLLSLGRNAFKKAMEKYNQAIKNEQSASLFGDKKSAHDIFNIIIIASIPEKELKIFNH